MAKTVKFNIDLNVNGRKVVIQASSSVDDLARAVGAVANKTKDLTSKLTRIGNISMIATNMKQAFDTVADTTKVLTDAYSVQLEAETKLQTVMQQRMNASAADIQAIKDLASAQQELGVIGDEVTLMGAQQLATFASHRQTVETLIPSMLNLLAQQKGFSATAQDSVAIANLFGKALQGNASALTRVGITMTDAQKEALKLGTEQERAAMLAKIITENVGNMNERLAQTDPGKAKQVANAFGDWLEKVGELIMPHQMLITQIGALGSAVNTFLMLAKGAQGLYIATTQAWQAITIFYNRCSLATRTVLTLNRAMALFGQSSRFGIVAVNGLKVAIRGLMIASGVAVAIAALVTVVDMFSSTADAAADSSQNLEDAQNSLQSQLAGTQAQIATDIEMLRNFSGTQQQEDAIVQQLNQTYGQTLGYFSSVSQWYNALTKDSEAYCQQMMLEIQIAQVRARIENRMDDINKLLYNPDGSRRRFSTIDKTKTVTLDPIMDTSFGGSKMYQGMRKIEVRDPGTSPHAKATAEYNELQRQNNEDLKLIKGLIDKKNKIVIPVVGARTMPTAAPAKPTRHTTARSTPKPDNPEKPDPEKTEPDPTEEEMLQALIDELEEQVVRAETTRKKAVDAAVKVAEAAEGSPEEIAAIKQAQQQIIDDAEKNFAETSTSAADQIAAAKERLEELKNIREKLSVTDSPTNYAEIDAALAYYNNLITTADAETLPKLTAVVRRLERMRKILEIQARPLEAPVSGKLMSADDIDEARSAYSDAMRIADPENVLPYASILADLSKKQQTLDFILSIPDLEREIADLKKLEQLDGKAYRLKIDALGIDGVKEKIKELQRLLDDTENPLPKDARQSVEEMLSYYKKIGKSLTGLKAKMDLYDGIASTARAVGQLSQSFKQLDADSKALATSMTAVTLAASLAELIAGMVKKNNESTLTIWDWIAGLAAGTATVVSAAASLKGIGAFADGGVVSGPTLALVGEYAGATNNPEVIAPLSKLQSMISTDAAPAGRVEFDIRGRKLVGIMKKENRLNSRR